MFSTFGLDTITLLRTQSTAAAAWNIAGHCGAGLLAIYVGVLAGTRG